MFDREVFQYPPFTRLNPFRPLEATEGGPRFEQLTLIGIMYSEDPASSVAVVTTGQVTIGDDGTMSGEEGDAYYMKVGDTRGNITITAIRRDEVDVTVTEFGQAITRTMRFVSRRPGGTP